MTCSNFTAKQEFETLYLTVEPLSDFGDTDLVTSTVEQQMIHLHHSTSFSFSSANLPMIFDLQHFPVSEDHKNLSYQDCDFAQAACLKYDDLHHFNDQSIGTEIISQKKIHIEIADRADDAPLASPQTASTVSVNSDSSWDPPWQDSLNQAVALLEGIKIVDMGDVSMRRRKKRLENPGGSSTAQ